MAKERRSDLEIDETRLDEEWRRQAGLTLKWAESEADARHDHAQAKAELDLVEAQLRHGVRRNPGKYNLPDKPTESAIGAVVTMSGTYQAALEKVNSSKRDLDYISGMVSAMVDRRKALERLVELIALHYYAEQEPRTRSAAGSRQQRDRDEDQVRGKTRSAP